MVCGQGGYLLLKLFREKALIVTDTINNALMCSDGG